MTSQFLHEDELDIKMQQQGIEIAMADLQDARRRQIDEKKPAEVAAKDNEVKAAKQEVETLQRDLRSFIRNARGRYDNAIQAAAKATPLSTPTAANPQSVTCAAEDIKISDPDKFDGNISDYVRWKFECQNVIAARGRMDNDDKKIRYMGSRMEKAALQWYQLYCRKRDTLLGMQTPDATEARRRMAEYEYFLNDLDAKFKDPQELQTYRSKVRNSTQGAMEFNDYSIHFHNLLLRAGLDEDTQVEAFLESLQPSILRGWKPTVMPTTFNEAVSSLRQSIQIQNTIRLAEVNSKGKTVASSSLNRGQTTTPHSAKISTIGSWNDPSRPGPFTSNSLKPLYQKRLDKGWCTRCGMQNHATSSCKTYPLSNTNAENFTEWQRINKKYLKDGKGGINYEGGGSRQDVRAIKYNDDSDGSPDIGQFASMYLQNEEIDVTRAYSIGFEQAITPCRKYEPHFLIPFTMRRHGSSVLIQGKALLDSGASRSFIGKRFATQHQIKIKPLSKPLRLSLADGNYAKALTHRSTELAMQINKHLERIVLLVFDTQEYDIILGLDWLTFHNPHIDWELRTIKFSGYGCQHSDQPHQMPVLASARIQTSGLSPNAVVTSNPIQSPELTQEEKQKLPPSTWPMSEFPVVFDMNKQSNLPLPRPGWDFDVTFKDSNILPKPRPLFRLSNDQKKLVEEYITSEVKSGKLRVSNSPVSSN
ncbi:hypothetical protein SeLEV6574_g08445, partial [Synchytrium endobioticum]